MNMQTVDVDFVNAQIETLVSQRNAALNMVVELSAKLATANASIQLLCENGEKLVTELESFSTMSTIVGLL